MSGQHIDFYWTDVTIGSSLSAVNFACKNRFFLIKNREPCYHSYEGKQEIWAKKIYELYNFGKIPITENVNSVRIISDDRLIKVFTDNSTFVIQYENIHIFDLENVVGSNMVKELLHYRVVDWFDCRGLHNLELDEIDTSSNFVRKVKFFQTCRVDGNQKYLDLLCESFLSEEQLKSFEFSDTMARFKVADLLKDHGASNIKMTLWKRDVYPVYKRLS